MRLSEVNHTVELGLGLILLQFSRSEMSLLVPRCSIDYTILNRFQEPRESVRKNGIMKLRQLCIRYMNEVRTGEFVRLYLMLLLVTLG